MPEVYFIDDVREPTAFEALKNSVVTAAGRMSQQEILDLADTLHDMLRARREAAFESIVEAGLA